MKNLRDKFLGGLVGGLGFISIIGLTGVAYGAYVALTDVTPGTPLTSSLFNQVLENQRTLKNSVVPTGFVGSFYLSTCPTGWLPADGTNGTPDLRNKFIRGVSSTRTLGNIENGTLVNAVGEIGGSNDIYFGADNGSYNSDYDEIVAGQTPRTGRLYIAGAYQPDFERPNRVRVRPYNMALLYCVKQ